MLPPLYCRALHLPDLSILLCWPEVTSILACFGINYFLEHVVFTPCSGAVMVASLEPENQTILSSTWLPRSFLSLLCLLLRYCFPLQLVFQFLWSSYSRGRDWLHRRLVIPEVPICNLKIILSVLSKRCCASSSLMQVLNPFTPVWILFWCYCQQFGFWKWRKTKANNNSCAFATNG